MNNMDAIVALLALQQNRLPPPPLSEDAFYNRHAGTGWPWLRWLARRILPARGRWQARTERGSGPDVRCTLSRSCADEAGIECSEPNRKAA